MRAREVRATQIGGDEHRLAPLVVALSRFAALNRMYAQ